MTTEGRIIDELTNALRACGTLANALADTVDNGEVDARDAAAILANITRDITALSAQLDTPDAPAKPRAADNTLLTEAGDAIVRVWDYLHSGLPDVPTGTTRTMIKDLVVACRALVRHARA